MRSLSLACAWCKHFDWTGWFLKAVLELLAEYDAFRLDQPLDDFNLIDPLTFI
jgi:hypothetical protein